MISTYPESRPGLSLKYAYQPHSPGEALENYNNHTCAACAASIAVDRLPEVPLLKIGSIAFQILPKSCPCGYSNEIFFVLNYLWRGEDGKIIPPDEAIAEAEKAGLLPDPVLEEGLVAAQAAIHRGEVDLAIEINRHLSVRFPKIFLPFYNLGVIYSRQQRYLDSLLAYETALKLNPKHGESLANKAQILMKLSRLQEAGETYDKWREVNSEETVILAEEEGIFGKIKVTDTPETRSLYIDRQLQGRVYKQPSANEWEPNCRSGSGPLSDNFFVSGVFLLGCQAPNGSGQVSKCIW
jgi:tetratricopeptide (TPR) repeat protein